MHEFGQTNKIMVIAKFWHRWITVFVSAQIQRVLDHADNCSCGEIFDRGIPTNVTCDNCSHFVYTVNNCCHMLLNTIKVFGLNARGYHLTAFIACVSVTRADLSTVSSLPRYLLVCSVLFSVLSIDVRLQLCQPCFSSWLAWLCSCRMLTLSVCGREDSWKHKLLFLQSHESSCSRLHQSYDA